MEGYRPYRGDLDDVVSVRGGGGGGGATRMK
jgi:hypothetical protein